MRAAFCQILTARRYGVVFLIIEFRKVRRRKTAEPFFFHRRRAQISARGTSRSALVASGAGNFALRTRCKWRGELRAPRSLQVARGTSRSALVASGAGNFALRARCKFRGELRFIQCTARMPCRILAQQPRIFAQQKYGSEGTRMYRERPLLGFVRMSREVKNVRDIFLYIRDAKKSCALLGFVQISPEAKNGRAVFLS